MDSKRLFYDLQIKCIKEVAHYPLSTLLPYFVALMIDIVFRFPVYFLQGLFFNTLKFLLQVLFHIRVYTIYWKILRLISET